MFRRPPAFYLHPVFPFSSRVFSHFAFANPNLKKPLGQGSLPREERYKLRVNMPTSAKFGKQIPPHRLPVAVIIWVINFANEKFVRVWL
jgi:hypothetical protein